MLTDRKSFKLKMVLTLLLLFSVSMLRTMCFAAYSNVVDIEVKGGYEGIGVVGAYNPFRITVQNKGDDFSGEIQLTEENNQNDKFVYSETANMASGATKNFNIDAPVNLINSKEQIKLVSNGKTVKSINFRFNKLISPISPLMGILCDDASGLDGLKGLNLLEKSSWNMLIGSVSNRVGSSIEYSAIAKLRFSNSKELSYRPAEFLSLNSSNFPENIKSLRAFNFLLLSNFDTSELSDNQKSALSKWVEEGGFLLIGTGYNWEKVYSGLPSTLKPFLIDCSSALSTSHALAAFAGKKNQLLGLDIVTGNNADGKVLINENGTPLAVSYKKGNGLITLMAFDPSSDPVSEWDGLQPLIKNLIETSASIQDIKSNDFLPLIQSESYKKLSDRLPDSNTKIPFIILLIIVIYILIVGPCAYVFLKWSGKSNLYLSFVLITAFVFTVVIYMTGIRMHFTSSAVNSVSIINVDDASKTENVNMYITALSNKSGKMKISYEDYTDIYTKSSSDLSDSQQDQNSNIECKFYENPSPTCEVFETKVWEAIPFEASKVYPLEEQVLNSVSIKNGEIKAIVKNPTQFDFKQGFIIYSGRLAYIGDIARGEEKSVDIEDSSKLMDLKSFLNSNEQTVDIKENSRIKALINTFYKNYSKDKSNNDKLTFCALNSDTPSGHFKINDKSPEYFSSNLIYTSF